MISSESSATPRVVSVDRHELAATFPNLDTRYRDAQRRLHADHRLTVCAHARASALLFACSEHTAAGLLCPTCLAEHAGRHPHELEHRCDECGHQAHTLRSFIGGTVAVPLRVVDRRGRPAFVFGTILIGCLGICDRCYRLRRAA